MHSIWSEQNKKEHFTPLKKDLKTDVLIIGGGLAGILCAYFLQQAGVNYSLIEQNEIGNGVTKNTTAKITAQHALCYHKFLKKFGKEKTSAYLYANLSAVEKYRKLCKNIRCDFQDKPSFVYSQKNKRRLENEVSALEKLSYKVGFSETLPLPFDTVGGIRFDNQAQFHPLKFLYSIANELHIFEHTKAVDFFDGGVYTETGKIYAKKIIVATHFPFLNKHGSYFIKQYQSRSYVLALKNAPNLNGTYIEDIENGFSFRNFGEYLLLGGGGHRTGEQGGNWQVLHALAEKYYPDATPAYQWATQDCITLDGMPYIGRYASSTPNLFVATGFNKWGFTSAMVCAELLCDLVQEKKNPLLEVFSPSRTMLRGRLFSNLAKSALHLITPTTPRCPHLGCALKYNPQERSWDCPCHGSRFHEDGTLIDNPSTKNLRK